MSDVPNAISSRGTRAIDVSPKHWHALQRVDVWCWLARWLENYQRSKAKLVAFGGKFPPASIANNIRSFEWRAQAIRELMCQLDKKRYDKEIRPKGSTDATGGTSEGTSGSEGSDRISEGGDDRGGA